MTARSHVVLEALQVRKNPTGTGRVILDLCLALAEQDRGMDFTVLSTEADLFGELIGRPGWRVVECPQASGGSLRKALFTQFQLPGLVKRLKGDLLHCMQFLVPLRCGLPQVATVHDMAWLLFPETIEEPRRSYYRWLVPRSIDRVDAILTNSQSTAADTRRFFPHAADKIRVTPFGTPRWVKGRQRPATGCPVPGSRPYFLFVGTFEPRKNLDRLVRAYQSFLESEETGAADPDSVPDLLFVGGKGWKDTHLRSRMAELRRRDRLQIRDYCGPDDLWELYCGALALVFPSLNEGFGLPVLEAMAAGCPVLTADRGGTAEVAGDMALLVDPENTAEIAKGLCQLAFDPTLRSRLATGGPDRAGQWSWSRTADLTVEVYRRLLETGSGEKGLPPNG